MTWASLARASSASPARWRTISRSKRAMVLGSTPVGGAEASPASAGAMVASAGSPASPASPASSPASPPARRGRRRRPRGRPRAPQIQL